MKKELNEIEGFINQNAYWIYKYINNKVLKNIGTMNCLYFINILEDIFAKGSNNQLTQFTKQNNNLLPYYILKLINGSGTMPYTSIRPDTIDFRILNKEASTYYNYLRFSLDNDFLILELMQSKTGGMPIDADFVKYKKNITIDLLGLSEYIKSNKNSEKDFDIEDKKIIDNAINKIFI